MAFNINDFKSQLQFSGARPNLFSVELTMPGIISSDASRAIQFMCKAASLPPSTLGNIEIPYFGRKIKSPGDRTYIEWVITIINDEDFTLRREFESWSQKINDPVENVRVSPANSKLSSIYGQASIKQYSKTGKVIYQYDLVDVWPSEVSVLETSWETNDTIEEYQVTLQYNYWVTKKEGMESPK